jgi:maltose alpha-D-glucosyltransferase/alpha-amylase
LLALEDDVAAKFGGLIEGRITGRRIRTHGDYHLGQVLYTGKDFVIIDFEGEPSRPLGERRLKRSALRDVAGMLRSFHYAAFSPLMQGEVPGARSRDATQSELGARLWYDWVGAEYLRAYLKTAEGAQFLPGSRRELKVLLDVHLLEKAIYELGYELNNRPEWIEIPLRGVLELMGSPRKD